MTITQAAKRVLEKSKSSMTVDEILESIRTEHLYEFKAKDARGVLRKQLRRHADGSSYAAAKYFVVDSSGRYSLK